MKKKKYLALFLVAIWVALLFTGCNKGKYGEDTKVKSEEITHSLVQALAEGAYEKAADDFLYTTKAKEEMDAQSLERLWEKLSDGKGDFREIAGLEDDNWDKELKITVTCSFEKGTAELVVAFDRTVKIKSIYPG
ncbi:DUF3887 domain-containing protein [Eubacterium maltosivorans]|uniref:DUF3887 domain-containing protein n=1 Tax=Eubacterium maltosivorans TaxID=2041044 RepID=UPI00189F85E2|nr:DUF3887 domain-containing protein [Eubacterium maltosivorans]